MRWLERLILTLLLRYLPIPDHKYGAWCLRCKLTDRRETLAKWR